MVSEDFARLINVRMDSMKTLENLVESMGPVKNLDHFVDSDGNDKFGIRRARTVQTLKDKCQLDFDKTQDKSINLLSKN